MFVTIRWVFREKTLTITYLHEVITKMRIGEVSTKGFKNLINKKKGILLGIKK